MHRASSSSVISRRLLSASLRHRNPAPPAVRESYLALSHFFRNYATTTTTTSPTSRLLLERTQAGHGRTSIRHLATTSLLREAAKEAAVQSSTPAEKGDAHGSATSSTSVQKPDHSPSAVAPYTEPNHDVLRHVSSFPASLRRLALSLPHSHLRRPTKEELLSGTSSFLERLRIRFKWFTIRGFRRFRADDWSAFASWIVGGVGIWIVVGTTSFFSAVFLLLNSLQMQQYIAEWLGSYLTSTSGITIVFESAIVPKFSLRESKLTFKNVYLSRGSDEALEKRALASPYGAEQLLGREVEETTKTKDGSRVSKGISRVRRASVEALADLRHRDTQRMTRTAQQQAQQDFAASVFANETVHPDPHDAAAQSTHFHLSVDAIDVELSLPRWLDGKGLVKEAVVKGVRGVIDRGHIRHVDSDPNDPLDFRRFRHTAKPGDFQLESLTLEDFLVTIYQPDNFRPYTFSIFSMNIVSGLRKQWLFFDLLSAESITGQVDNCLFSLHRPQSIGRTSEEDLRDCTWKRMSRFRIDGVPIDHLQSARDTGLMSWITSGKADLVADIRFPREPGDDVDLNTIIGNIVDNLDEALSLGSNNSTTAERLSMAQELNDRIPGKQPLAGGKPLEPPSRPPSLRQILGIQREGEEGPDGSSAVEDVQRPVSIDLDIRFKDLKARVPLFTSTLSPVNTALVRPIVGFINSNRTLIPVKCHLDIDLQEFNGSWTTYDIGLLDAVSAQVYDALAHHVQSRTNNVERAKTVGLWSLQQSAKTLLGALKQNLEHY